MFDINTMLINKNEHALQDKIILNIEDFLLQYNKFHNFLQNKGVEVKSSDFPLNLITGEKYSILPELGISKTKDVLCDRNNSDIKLHKMEIRNAREIASENKDDTYMFLTNGCKLSPYANSLLEACFTEELYIKGKYMSPIIVKYGLGRPFTEKELKYRVCASSNSVLVKINDIPQVAFKENEASLIKCKQQLERDVIEKLLYSSYYKLAELAIPIIKKIGLSNLEELAIEECLIIEDEAILESFRSKINIFTFNHELSKEDKESCEYFKLLIDLNSTKAKTDKALFEDILLRVERKKAEIFEDQNFCTQTLKTFYCKILELQEKTTLSSLKDLYEDFLKEEEFDINATNKESLCERIKNFFCCDRRSSISSLDTIENLSRLSQIEEEGSAPHTRLNRRNGRSYLTAQR